MDISIPQHCSQEWDKMKPTDGGKFCDICSMFVVDFTTMTREEIIDYKQKTEGKLCARISTYQLTAKSIQRTNLYLNSIKPLEREFVDSLNYLFLRGYVINNEAKPIINAKIEFSVWTRKKLKEGEEILTTSTDKNGKFSFYLPIAISDTQCIESYHILNRKQKHVLTIYKEDFEKYTTKVKIQYEPNRFIKLNSKLNLKVNNTYEKSVKTIYGIVHQDLEPYILIQN